MGFALIVTEVGLAEIALNATKRPEMGWVVCRTLMVEL